MTEILIDAAAGQTEVTLLTAEDAPGWVAAQQGLTASLAALQGFEGKAGSALVVPGEGGGVAQVAFGMGRGRDGMVLRGLAGRLPPGDYRLSGLEAPTLAAAAIAIGAYVFDRYKPRPAKPPVRVAVVDADLAEARRIAHAAALARDMINTPAGDLGPRQIESIAREIAELHGATVAVTIGEALLEANYPAIHAVGRAAALDRAPRLIVLSWGDPAAPAVALVGKGVTFDTGGLNLKTGAGMKLMKKDMGGAAHALAVARMVMGAGLPVRLIVLLAVVENAVSGDALRPGDIIGTRKGLTVEVGNTDAEGRLILADALTRAAEHAPALTVDFATLTGAARVALGPWLPPLYCDDEAFTGEVLAAGTAVADPLWRLPLWMPYDAALDSEIADLVNDPEGWAQAGSITAALFLRRFAPASGVWAHLDVMAWNPKSRPGWPVGGELQGGRAVYEALRRRFAP